VVQVIPTNTVMLVATQTQEPTAVFTIAPPAAPTAIPTITATPSPTYTPTPTNTPTPSPTATKEACNQRIPNSDDLLVIVTQKFGLSQAYKPADLVPIAPHISHEVTLGYPTEVRAEILDPLVEMINDMLALGLQPTIISSYRSYATQQTAYNKWLIEEPERADELSAQPGHSEHQLGTTVDFGSKNLHDYIDDSFDENLQFHTYFYKTPEGAWLLENGHLYGFTLSYPREAQEITGFFYEPWHYRYVGVENATILHDNNISLTEYLLNQDPVPCIAD
jgi:D-alanyl-D-alanine carboxypeptidase